MDIIAIIGVVTALAGIVVAAKIKGWEGLCILVYL